MSDKEKTIDYSRSFLGEQPKYKIGQFVQSKHIEEFHGHITDISETFVLDKFYDYSNEINDHGEICFVFEKSLDEFYEVI
ncbi:MAG: hypothetical protein AABY22_19285 [Nanoarchaeota archaeon]